MPPQQQRFEGTDLEDLLREVREKFGDQVTIVEANRLRRGGIAGFFAQERYEVIVDVPEAPESGAEASAALLAEQPPRKGRSLLEWADDVSDGERPGSNVSTEGGQFADVLARIAQSTDPGVQAAELVDLTEPFEAWPAVKAVAEAAVTMGAIAREGASELATTPTGSYPTTRPITGDAPITPPGFGSVVPRNEPADQLARIDVRPLLAAGIPADLAVRGESESDLPRAILRALEHIPRADPLPDLPGAVIAVVGERRAALALGQQLAEELGLEPDGVLLASGRYHGSAVEDHLRVDTAAQATERRRGLRRRLRPTVVAIDATAARRDGAWACEMLDSLEVTVTWATVEAARKPEDVQAWAQALGGVDVLAVTDLDQTVSPASVLQTGMPVGRLDGIPASPAQWAALITDRLAA